MNTKFIKFTAAMILGVLLIGCQKDNTNTGITNSTANGVETGQNVNRNNANNKNSNPQNTAAKTVESTAPTRVAFNKGANWGAVNITLAPGASQKFVVGAKSGQTMDVEASSKEVSINLIKGKAETTEDFGFLNAELQANGDYVFEVKNSTKKEIKTSIKVTIEGDEPIQRGVLNDVDEENKSEANEK